MAHVLCIHPWIYDFAAYNTWIEPLGLLAVAGGMFAEGIDYPGGGLRGVAGHEGPA